MRAMCFAAVTVLACVSQADEISSTFNSDAEGWTGYGDFGDFAWSGVEGNPAGSIYAMDEGRGIYWGFSAPAAYLGDIGRFAGGTLSWETKTSHYSSGSEDVAGITLTGGGMELVAGSCPPEVGKWSRRSVVLSHDAGWKVGTMSGAAPTAEQFAAVLADVEAIEIRQEFSSARDSAYFDNVRLRTSEFAPCRSDCNSDCKNDINDFICFQAKWRAKDAYGDYNRDGRWNINDFISYQADFRTGCR